jgi:hypothetical protein
MFVQGYKLNSGEILTESMIRQLCAEQKKIALIKLYREISGKGLKDSKNIIETAAPYSPGNMIQPPYDANKMVELFSKWLRKYNIDFMTEGINVAMNNWEAMGFSSPFESARMVIENFEIKSLTGE